MEGRPATEDRKELAHYFKHCFEGRYSHVLFAMLDNKDYASIIWKMVKPRGDKTFKVDGEA
jgi:hypothetical protein